MGADGGPTQNGYLMQMQSDISGLTVAISDVEELSALGAAYLAGISVGLYEKEKLFAQRAKVRYTPKMPEEERQQKLHDWNRAVELLLR
nr:FGGY-family carbohydrate kinase [uncultured Agathobaculum sp.]